MITILAGGSGAAKFLKGLVRVRPREEMTVVVNTADDVILHGLHISPDVDTVLYALAGVLSRKRGWGIQGDSFRCNDRLGTLGLENWFQLGDLDLATHIYRTWRLSQGATPTKVTEELGQALGIRSKVLPMTDSRVETRLMTELGELSFQEYFVKHRHRPKVLEVAYRGIEEAAAAPGVLRAIEEAKTIVIAPSNPVTSIGPIISLPDLRQALRRAEGRRAAISPFVEGRAISGPADLLMGVWGLDPTPGGLAAAYSHLIDYLIIDEADEGWTQEVQRLGITAVAARIIMRGPEEEVALARETMKALEGVS
jgi:LPPG:FO 2-phospho-L-lactate transferase